jgi:hypothetical protein
MKTKQLRWTARLLLLNAALVVVATGCATRMQGSYNQDFNQNLPIAPQYAIENVDDAHFQVIIHQGSPLQGPERISYMKEAATGVARDEAKRRGWQNWDLEYIQERDQGWMHIVIVEVTRENAAARLPADTNNP